jgi:LPXTG-motif cell wall-anchored protein
MGIKRAFQVVVVGLLVTAGAAGAAGAQENPDYTAPAPQVEVTVPPIQTFRSAPAAPATPSDTPLPVTGADVAQLLLLGGALVAGGAGILALRRRAPV